MYRSVLDKNLKALDDLNVIETGSQSAAQSAIDQYICDINNVIHASTLEAGCVPTNRFKPKPYWCPQLSELRNKKRFWWNLWVANDRPRVGAVFECYKGVKRMFRSCSRKCMSNVLNNKFSAYNNLFQRKKFGLFWKNVRNSRKSKPSSRLNVDALAAHYSNVMNDDGALNSAQSDI
jgi:hypothetical protein